MTFRFDCVKCKSAFAIPFKSVIDSNGISCPSCGEKLSEEMLKDIKELSTSFSKYAEKCEINNIHEHRRFEVGISVERGYN